MQLMSAVIFTLQILQAMITNISGGFIATWLEPFHGMSVYKTDCQRTVERIDNLRQQYLQALLSHVSVFHENFSSLQENALGW